MKKEIIEYVASNLLSPFNDKKSDIENQEGIFRTKDAKLVYNRIITKLSEEFYFNDTRNLWKFFTFTEDFNEITRRQNFFKNIEKRDDKSFLKNIKKRKEFWRPKYSVVVVTQDEKTLIRLQSLGCATKFLISESDLTSLEHYDVIQVIDCDEFSRALENLPQAIFVDSIEDIYLERYLTILSGWKENIEILKQNKIDEDSDVLINELYSLLEFLNINDNKHLSLEDVEKEVNKINDSISIEIKKLTISGELLLNMLGKNHLPEDIQKIIRTEIDKSNLPKNILNVGIPVSIDELELSALIKRQEVREFADLSEKIYRKSSELKKVPEKIKKISDILLYFDFISGISFYLYQCNSFPLSGDSFAFEKSENIMLEKAQGVSFYLNDNERCSILTGANSGGKTTLLEHIIQLIVISQFGLPVKGKLESPIFTDVYYFAKNKGSLNKGAFETLLTQMSKINPGKKTLILADEIESVTEPGVAGKIISASADFFIKKNCFLVIATHLGQEIKEILPEKARIDGIEAKGLDENYELIVDHSPVIGRLANSTPELIVEKMANSVKGDYFIYLNDFLKK